MVRFPTLLVAFLALTFIQICAALKPHKGLSYLALDDLYLTPATRPRTPVRLLSRPGLHSEWIVRYDDEDIVTIEHAVNGQYLSYDVATPSSYVILKPHPRQWRLNQLDDGKIEIQTVERFWDQHLVLECYPGRGDGANVQLVYKGETNRPGWTFQSLEENIQAFALPDGEYNLRFRGFYLTQPEFADQSVLLDTNQGAASEWEVVNDGGSRGITIRNVKSGLFLSYLDVRPNTMLRLQRRPTYWALKHGAAGRLQIQATELYNGEVLVIDELPLEVYPPRIGLVLPQKSNLHDWDFKPVMGSSAHHDQHRLPYRKLDLWWE